MHRIYADFNNRETYERVRLDTNGSMADIATLPELHSGMKVVVYDEEVEVDAVLVFKDGICEGAPIAVPADLQISAYLSPPVPGGQIRSGSGHQVRCGAGRRCSPDARL